MSLFLYSSIYRRHCSKDIFVGHIYFSITASKRFRNCGSSWRRYVSDAMKFFEIVTSLPAKLLLTPFRSQNVPPPMSSFQLPMSPDFSLQPSTPTQIPIYVAFSSQNDAMGVLWEHGYVELWDLKTRLLPGPGKIMDPSKLWSGVISEKLNIRWRQLTVKFEGSYTIIVLGTGPGSQKDVVSTVTVTDDSTTAKTTVSLPHRNCRLPFGAVINTYLGLDGNIFSCEYAITTSFGKELSIDEQIRMRRKFLSLWRASPSSASTLISSPSYPSRRIKLKNKSYTLAWQNLASFIYQNQMRRQEQYRQMQHLSPSLLALSSSQQTRMRLSLLLLQHCRNCLNGKRVRQWIFLPSGQHARWKEDQG